MNILNVPEELVTQKLHEYQNGDSDTFQLLFKIGKNYMQKYGTKKVNIHTKEGQEAVRKIVFSMTEELYEFCNTLKNKSWTTEDYPVDEEHMMEELCDVMAFVVQLLLMLDFDSEKFKRLYLKKEVVNDFRLRSKY